MKAKTPVVAFTATRWRSLLEPHAGWSEAPPTATECYRYCLAERAVHVVLTAPQSMNELNENLEVLNQPAMDAKTRHHWERFGDLVYKAGRGKSKNNKPRGLKKPGTVPALARFPASVLHFFAPVNLHPPPPPYPIEPDRQKQIDDLVRN